MRNHTGYTVDRRKNQMKLSKQKQLELLNLNYHLTFLFTFIICVHILCIYIIFYLDIFAVQSIYVLLLLSFFMIGCIISRMLG